MNVTAISSSNYPQPQANRVAKDESSPEGSEEAAALALLQSLGQPQPISKTVTSLGQQPVQAPGLQALQGKASAAQASGQSATGEMLGAGDVARASQNSAVSMNTGAAIAGLQPWSKDWVFTQGDQKNPELKGLISRGDAAQTTGPGNAAVSPEVKAAIAQKLGLQASEMPELDKILSQMNGSMEIAANEGAAAAKPQGAKMLGGNDFLGAMGLAQPMRVGSADQQKSAAFGNSSQQQGQGSGLAGQSGRPELKILDGGKVKKAGAFELGDAGLPALSGAEILRQSSNPALANAGQLRLPEVTGHVVSGRMSQDRLSSESLMGITQNIAGMGGMRGGTGSGEIRVRLKPENLGELHLRVMTDGNSVALRIQASDPRAKQILEESLPHLKDSLQAASLSLGKVEVSVAQAPSQNFADGRQDPSSQSQSQSQAFGDLTRNNQQSGSNSQSRWDSDGTASNVRPAAQSWVAPTPSTANRASASYSSGGSRLDLHA